MNKITEEFVSKEEKNYKFRVGRMLASGLSGFIVGGLVTTLVFFVLRHLGLF